MVAKCLQLEPQKEPKRAAAIGVSRSNRLKKQSQSFFFLYSKCDPDFDDLVKFPCLLWPEKAFATRVVGSPRNFIQLLLIATRLVLGDAFVELFKQGTFVSPMID